ncbi:multidrug resistance-associated protein 1 isoform X1 [Daktulosphaira vitifoliae]|uniref:multidrug resistance-associated protein 1 isoform X1 n=1 Tax=Daktulosphaira vitifoliae TaxID=58002 RepID=UPI0021AAB984|nr:multidrug resistance-associated protein 1 isoform X1 [Daktulosphaira vitifoliae]
MEITDFDRFCGSPFWDYNLSWNTTNPDLTLCFEKTILVWMPCLFLWVFSPLEVFYLVHSKFRDIPWNWLNLSKMVGAALLCLVSISDLVYAIIQYSSGSATYSVDFYSPLVKLLTIGFVMVLINANRARGLRSSGLIFLFWLMLAFNGLIQYRTEIRLALSQQYHQKYQFISYMIYYPLVLIQLILNFFADTEPRLSDYSPVEKPCPEVKASYPSRILFSWFDTMAWTGYKRPLEAKDLWSMNYEDSSREVVPIFDKHWERSLIKAKVQNQSTKASYIKHTSDGSIEVQPVEYLKLKSSSQHQASIFPTLCKSFGSTFLFGSFLKVIEDCLVFISPQVLKYLIAFVGSKDEPLWRGYFYVFLMMLSATLQTLVLAQYFHRMYLVGMRVRTALTSAIYRKALRISNKARKTFTVGEIVNLMAVDAHRFVDLTTYLNMIWSAPFQIALAIYFLWQILGPSVLAGLFVMIVLIPINGVVAAKARSLQIKQMKNKDERVKLMNEILSGIKVLKLYAWEPSFEQKILDIRGKEIRVLRTAAYLNAATSFIWACAPFLVSLVTFAVYVLSDDSHILDAETAFVSLSLFNILRFPLSMLPMFVSNVVQSSVSVKRINKFMNCEELDLDAVSHDADERDPIVVENGTFTWGEPTEVPTLSDINLRISAGQLVAVVGTVGSGKSSLVSAFLGEMDKVTGRVNTKGTIAYVPQQAWIQNTSLKENILFGQTLSERAYNKVIEACALRADFQMLPAGDGTEIGEKGINLSGGQKQRVSLARAVYKESDIYFLDDPLSAVDSHVGKHIFEQVIGPTGLLRKKTRVLVTHSVTYLREVDLIVVMKDGKISESGTYKELLDKKGDFADFLITHMQDQVTNDGAENDIDKLLEDAPADLKEKYVRQRSESNSMHSMQRQISIDSEKPEKPVAVPELAKLIEVEKAETGSVKWEVYVHYLKSIGPFLCISTIFLSVVFQSFSISSNLWLSKWSNDNTSHVHGKENEDVRNLYLGVYALLGFGQAISTVGSATSLSLGCVIAAEKLFHLINARIFKNPLSLFDTTPSGRILNRVSKDIDTIDNLLPFILRSTSMTMFSVIGTLFVISYSTPIFTSVIIPIGFVYYFIQRFYVATSRQLKRLESVSRSPIYSHFSETVTGAASIRAYGVESKFILQSEQKVDFNQTCYYPSTVSNRWLAVRLESIGNLLIFFASLFAVMGKDTISPGIVGLSISYALQITQTLNWLVRMSSEVETNIVAVERIKEYGETPQEAPWVIPSNPVPKNWPSRGELQIKNLKVRYREGLDLALKGLDIFVEGGTKVGIVGRTGAGKSSLTLSLFRIVEAAEGSIIVDGVDISDIGLHTLRGRLTIIPQDPVLFSGTLRMNLDPTNKSTDNQLWTALELAHLKAHIKNLPGGLDHEVSEGGENLSVGQRQLVCLARALLRKTKLLILDEATAAIDLETDDLIQTTIRTEFKDCTVLTIAHRLNTIMDSDKVIVLDNGQMIEYDSPNNLLQDKSSVFYLMAKDAGLSQ